MADISSQLVLNALSQAVAHSEGLPLHPGRGEQGLFPASAAGKQAAARCQADGYLSPVDGEPAAEPADPATPRPRRARPAPRCRITDRGLTYLLGQVSPRQVLEDLVRVLEARQGEMARWLAGVQQMQQSLQELRANAEKVLRHIQTPPAPSDARAGSPGSLSAMFFQLFHGHDAAESGGTNGLSFPAGAGEKGADPRATALSCLKNWQASGAPEDCPLPELYRQVQQLLPGQTLGAFHDDLRALHEAGQVYLHPWTGPLYELPEPRYALLVGHEIAYYASLR